MIPVDPIVPQDMRDLLIRVDTKVDGITNTLARMDRRADDHEQRITGLETWRASTTAQVEGAAKMGKAVWAIGAALFVALGYIGYEINVDPQTITSKRVETITAPVIANAN